MTETRLLRFFVVDSSEVLKKIFEVGILESLKQKSFLKERSRGVLQKHRTILWNCCDISIIWHGKFSASLQNGAKKLEPACSMHYPELPETSPQPA